MQEGRVAARAEEVGACIDSGQEGCKDDDAGNKAHDFLKLIEVR